MRQFDAEDVVPLAAGRSGSPPYIWRTPPGLASTRFLVRVGAGTLRSGPHEQVAPTWTHESQAAGFNSPLLVAVAVQQRAAAVAARDGVGAPSPAPHLSALDLRSNRASRIGAGPDENHGREGCRRDNRDRRPGGTAMFPRRTRTRASRRYIPATAPRRGYGPASPARGRFPTTTSAGSGRRAWPALPAAP